MLSDGALQYIQPLKLDPNAKRLICMAPLGGIFWDDEIPDFRRLMSMSDQDRDSILRLFAIRFRLWAGETLDNDDQAYWDAAIAQVPDFPLFHRISLSDDDRVAQHAAERETDATFEALFRDADEVMINEDGSWSTTFDLTKDETPSLWQRFLAWLRGT